MSTCYYPDGTVSDDVPCNSTASNSACCGSGAYCLGNGLCLVDGLTSRGSCTDESWDDEACTQYCRDTNASGGTPLRLCAINGADPNSFSCGTSLDNCVSGINTFTVTSNVVVPRPTQLSAFASLAGSSLVARAVSASATSTASSDAAASQNGTAQGGGPGGNDGYTGAELAGVGIGVGVPFAAAFFLTLILLAREKKRNRLLTAGGAAAYGPLKGDGGSGEQVYVQQTPQYHQHQQPGSELGSDGLRHELPVQK